MANVKRDDYENIVNNFNESGDKAAQDYIKDTYGNKDPRGVIYRIKKTPGFEYDSINKKIIKSAVTEEKIFMNIDELCNNVDSSEKITVNTYEPSNIEALYKELMEEKLLELIKYVKLNHYTSTISINKSALVADGYKITFN